MPPQKQRTLFRRRAAVSGALLWFVNFSAIWGQEVPVPVPVRTYFGTEDSIHFPSNQQVSLFVNKCEIPKKSIMCNIFYTLESKAIFLLLLFVNHQP